MRAVSVSEALSRKYPEWVMWVISCDAEGRPDLMPAGWCMVCNSTPVMMAVSVGFGRYTHTCIEETGEFILAWLGAGQEKLIDQCGSCSGRDTDKFAQFQIKTAPAQQVRAPLVEGCAAALECLVVSQIELEDHSIFVGEVVAAHVADPPVGKLENFNGQYAVARPTM